MHNQTCAFVHHLTKYNALISTIYVKLPIAMINIFVLKFNLFFSHIHFFVCLFIGLTNQLSEKTSKYKVLHAFSMRSFHGISIISSFLYRIRILCLKFRIPIRLGVIKNIRFFRNPVYPVCNP